MIQQEITSKKANYHSFQSAKGNIIWTSSLPLAWKRLGTEVKFQFEASQKTPELKKIVTNLTNSPCSFSDTDEKSMFYGGGIKKGVITSLNDEIQKKFPPNKRITLESIRNDQMVFCGILHKEVKLKSPFYKEPESIKYMFFEHRRVGCFQPITVEQKKQITVLNYTDEDNFMLKVQTLTENEEMFFIKTKHKVQLPQAIQKVMQSKEGQVLAEKDVFKIPIMSINCSNHYTQIIGSKGLIGQERRKFEVAQCMETFSFSIQSCFPKNQLDDNVFQLSEYQQPKLKKKMMCLNRAFWLIMKKKGCHPYMAMFVTKVNEKDRE